MDVWGGVGDWLVAAPSAVRHYNRPRLEAPSHCQGQLAALAPQAAFKSLPATASACSATHFLGLCERPHEIFVTVPVRQPAVRRERDQQAWEGLMLGAT